MRRQRSSDTVRDTITIVTTNGARLRCALSTVGRSSEPRWMILDQNGEQYLGPVAAGDRSLESDEAQLQAWWNERDKSASDVKPT